VTRCNQIMTRQDNKKGRQIKRRPFLTLKYVLR